MLRVASRAAVAAGKYLAAAGDAADERTDGVGDRLRQDFSGRVLQVGAIEELLLDQARVQALGEAGRRAVFESFSAEAMARAMAQVYAELAGKTR